MASEARNAGAFGGSLKSVKTYSNQKTQKNNAKQIKKHEYFLSYPIFGSF
jgi:hypothetical protein